MPFKKPTISLAPPVEDFDLSKTCVINESGTVRITTNKREELSFKTDGLVKDGQEFYKISDDDIIQVRTLGSGASGSVIKGFLHKENRFVAVKKVSINERERRHLMLKDVQALCDAHQMPGLIEFIGAYHEDSSSRICIVLEYMDAGSLADLQQKVKRIPEPVLSNITQQVLVGLVYLQKQKHMVHRDIKPANILLSQDGQAKITDFGISAFIDCTIALCHTFTGTVTYMSPERISSQPYSFPADIWSLGLALLECATGTFPYEAAAGPVQLMVHICEDEVPLPAPGVLGDDLRDFIRLCLQKDPSKRPTAEQLLQHPFITQHHVSTADMASFMQVMARPDDRTGDLAISFVYNYYPMLSSISQTAARLATLYTDSSVLSHQGQQATGQQCIIMLLQAFSATHAGFGAAGYQDLQWDVQPSIRGTVLLHVRGCLATGQFSSPFSECFLLAQTPAGEYFVANQAFRLM